MREIRHEMKATMQRIGKLKDMPVRLQINKGRNKFVQVDGTIRDTYPAVFTFVSGADVQTYSYSDVLTKNIRIFPQT